MDNETKVRENRMRRKLARMGYRLSRSGARDPKAYNFGGYMILDAWRNVPLAGAQPYQYSMSLDDVEKFAEREGPNRPKPKKGGK